MYLQHISGLSGDVHDDDLPYTTLAYSNGLAYYHNDLPPSEEDPEHVRRLDLTDDVDHVNSYNYAMTSSGESLTETHGGDDVLIFARGPGAQLFHQTHEESHIANVMAYAACVGRYSNFDDEELCQQRM